MAQLLQEYYQARRLSEEETTRGECPMLKERSLRQLMADITKLLNLKYAADDKSDKMGLYLFHLLQQIDT